MDISQLSMQLFPKLNEIITRYNTKVTMNIQELYFVFEYFCLYEIPFREIKALTALMTDVTVWEHRTAMFLLKCLCGNPPQKDKMDV